MRKLCLAADDHRSSVVCGFIDTSTHRLGVRSRSSRCRSRHFPRVSKMPRSDSEPQHHDLWTADCGLQIATNSPQRMKTTREGPAISSPSSTLSWLPRTARPCTFWHPTTEYDDILSKIDPTADNPSHGARWHKTISGYGRFSHNAHPSHLFSLVLSSFGHV